MSKDIRSFFSVVSKKTTPSKVQESKKKVKQLIDSDDEDVVECTPEKPKTKPAPSKRKIEILSSDSEGETSKNKEKPKDTKLKPVNIDDIFTNVPIKQSKVEPTPEGESKAKKEKQRTSKKKKSKIESGIHEDDAFEKTLLELDDDLLVENLDVLDKTIDTAMQDDKPEKQGSSKENSPNKPKDINEGNSNKRKKTSSEGSTPKKPKLEHTDSGIDPDQEAFEKKRYSAMLYQKYKNRAGPRMHGQKEIPKGKPDCLKNLTFLRTGVLESLEGEEFQNLVVEHGGRIVKAVSKKVNYVVCGEDAGPSKLEKARGFGIPEINEDEFFDLILVKSGMKPKYASTESGVFEEPLEEKKEIKETAKKDKHSPKEKGKETNESKETEKKDKHSQKERKRKTDESTEKSSSKKSNMEMESLHKKQKLEEKLPKLEITKRSPKKEPVPTKKAPDSPKKDQEKPDKLDPKPEKSQKIPAPSKAPAKQSLTWTEKYKPATVQNIIGDSSNVNKLKKWLNNWYRNQLPEVRKKIPRPSPWAKADDGAFYKAALLSGPPGVGKTTTATLVSKELGFDIVEFNASDTRSKKLLQEEVSQLLKTNTIARFATGKNQTDKKRVLLMDEVDGMAGNEDRGGIQELINLIKTSNVPIICMCNDRNHQKMRSLVNYCFDLRFSRPRLESIKAAMMSICAKEGVNLSSDIVSEIIAGTGCDIRQTLNHLTVYAALDENQSIEEVQKKAKEAKKDTILGPWEVVRLVFSESEQKKMSLADKSKLFFYDYSLGPLFVQENYLGVTPKCPKNEILKRVSLAAESISNGDVIDAKIRGFNNWSLLESQAMYSSVLPGYYMSGNVTSRINFPGWLGKNSSANKRKRLLSEIHAHTRTSTSGSVLAMKLDYLVHLRNAIITPMLKEGADGIMKSVKFMEEYNLLREDLNSLIELCQWKDGADPFKTVDPKVKAAFTRAYNKEIAKLPFAPGAGFSKKKVSHDNEGLDEDEDVAESDDEDKDDLGSDALIKVKTKSDDTKGKAGTTKAKASTSKAKTGTSKPRASTKGGAKRK